MNEDLSNIDNEQIQPIDINGLAQLNEAYHPPRVLMLYGSLRERSYSRLMTEEAARVLRHLGA